MEPSPEAIAWGKRQAERSPRWTDAKWRRVGTIFGVVLSPEAFPTERDQADDDQDDQIMRDAA
ncbi:hypothetical protein [Spirillospora sp. CA-128828]|uniref:hypothetical protein n=1 Tax=Spirillospora sp. CA-128828 TaxID=3240033 RepID=UPI003D8E560C